jgi:hypothetical protein
MQRVHFFTEECCQSMQNHIHRSIPLVVPLTKATSPQIVMANVSSVTLDNDIRLGYLTSPPNVAFGPHSIPPTADKLSSYEMESVPKTDKSSVLRFVWWSTDASTRILCNELMPVEMTRAIGSHPAPRLIPIRSSMQEDDNTPTGGQRHLITPCFVNLSGKEIHFAMVIRPCVLKRQQQLRLATAPACFCPAPKRRHVVLALDQNLWYCNSSTSPGWLPEPSWHHQSMLHFQVPAEC